MNIHTKVVGDNGGHGTASEPYKRAYAYLGDDWKRFRERLEEIIEGQSDLLDENACAFYRAGKRVRPLMTLLFAKLLAQPSEEPLADRTIAAAVSIEVVHFGSLIHDDIVDKAPLRRGLPTFNASRGYEFALLLGDLQIIESARVFASFLNSEKDLDLMRDYLNTGHNLCRGQIEELLADTGEWNLERIARRYYRIIDRKTARLFSFACETGGRLVDAYPSQVRAARHYGNFVGRAFQIVDDVLDVMQSTGDAGKEAFTDISLGRLSLPVIYALHLSPKDHAVHGLLRTDNPTPEGIAAGIEALFETKAHVHAYNEGRVMVIEAKSRLDKLPAGPANDLLRNLADHLVDQNFHKT